MLVLDMIYVDWICQKGKIYRYPWDVFLIPWTLLGSGRDSLACDFEIPLKGLAIQTLQFVTPRPPLKV